MLRESRSFSSLGLVLNVSDIYEGRGVSTNTSISGLNVNALDDVPLNAGSGFSTSFFGTFTSSVTPCKLLSKYGTLELVKMWEYSLMLASDEPATEGDDIGEEEWEGAGGGAR